MSFTALYKLTTETARPKTKNIKVAVGPVANAWSMKLPIAAPATIGITTA